MSRLDHIARLLLDLEEVMADCGDAVPEGLSHLDFSVENALAELMMWPDEHGISDETYARWEGEGV